MKKIEELIAGKVPIVIIDKFLDKLDEVVLFPEKVEEANETIAKIGLPKKSGYSRQKKYCQYWRSTSSPDVSCGSEHRCSEARTKTIQLSHHLQYSYVAEKVEMPT